MKPRVAIVGCFQNGKSTLVNCLLDDKVAQTGDGLATTHIPTIYSWGELQGVLLRTENGGQKAFPLNDFINAKAKADLSNIIEAKVSLWKPILKDVYIIDTPGFNAEASDDNRAIKSMEGADYLLIVLNNRELSEPEKLLLAEASKLMVPYSILVNCMDTGGTRWDPSAKSNEDILETIRDNIINFGYAPIPIKGKDSILPCNLLWFWYAAEHIFDNELKEIEKKINFFFNEQNKRMPTLKQLAEKSNFLPVRNFFQENPWGDYFTNNIVSRIRLENSFKTWREDFAQILAEAKESLK